MTLYPTWIQSSFDLHIYACIACCIFLSWLAFVLSVRVCSGDSRVTARPATRHRVPSGSFTRAATAPTPTTSGTAASAPTPAAARLFTPPPPRWPSTAPPADSYSERWWWSTRVFVITTAPTHLTVTLLCGASGPDRPAWALIHSEQELTRWLILKSHVDPHRHPLINGPFW